MLETKSFLPADSGAALLVGRVRIARRGGAPAVIVIRDGAVINISDRFPTITDVLEEADPAAAVRAAKGVSLGGIDPILADSAHDRRADAEVCFLAPCDLQAIKAAGVTFTRSLLERLIEEDTKGDASLADGARKAMESRLGVGLDSLVPGSPEALELRSILKERGAWSQYLEVGLGVDCELFTKSQPMSAVGTGMEIGIHRMSEWNNPEPEVVLAVNSRGDCVGATLGNDVNLRDVEGRSALLLGRAKDNNGSCAIGPLLRLFDGDFDMDRVRACEITLEVTGEDGFVLREVSRMKEISRDPLDIVAQATGPNHQYPDGMMLFLGSMFAPIKDRDGPGQGFTHKLHDIVRIACPDLGALVNRVNYSDAIPPWRYGLRALMQDLAERRA